MYYPDGSNLTVSLSEFNQAHQDSIQFCVIFATQIGACGILLLLVALLTQPEKRRTLLFTTNCLALVAVIVRSVLQILYYLGPFFDTYSYIAYDWSSVPLSARRVQVAGGAMGLALQFLIEMSLILQVRVVYASSPKTNLVMTLVSSVFALTAVSFFFTVVVQNSRAIMALDYYNGGWIYTTSKALFTATICFYSLIFVIKLGLAIHQRRVLGLRAFGPLQIIFTMGCQTMILPG
jgi:pheromone alpha factor receptor